MKDGSKFAVIAVVATVIIAMLLIAGKSDLGYGHPVMVGGVSNYFRIDNEQFSTNNVTLGDTFEVQLELRSLINRNITVTPLPLAESTKMPPLSSPDYTADIVPLSPDRWKIVNATFVDKFNLGPGETIPFNVNGTTLKPGSYWLHSAFAWSLIAENGTAIRNGTYYGRGQIVFVQNGSSNTADDNETVKQTNEPSQEQLQGCKELGIPLENCNDNAILAKMRIASHPVLSEEDIQKMQEQQNQINNSMYMIGIGAAIAGIIGFITLRKIKR